MEVYESPKMEVIEFDSEDVIITSCLTYADSNVVKGD